ncbi:MAG: phosphoribosylformylglycinamidine synthase subunit PurS [Candidatus Omnitrophica bacterium CG07_land_8_20_14_0_80_42_15]|uniref:Phosphoribosylformylglycinamidine synthase subunit PurS n=1 Tax=Candidatus Aquitaenariimonas noxiae TaxID=1974741 RepID=A0A2J0KUA6_9BACT|nr:MAG: phosphoribosylformylglycinamidine synthase subunit PurS [Candidatus Omnitrophica bacterium CG07_land_8_20_14_0_80_42_15]
MLKSEIYITLKKKIVDPQGLTIKHALESMGYKGLDEVRIGKFITIKIDCQNKEKAKKKIDNMCRKLLANPITEDYNVKMKGDK